MAVYLNDSVGMKITALDFDLSTGQISNQRTLVDFRGSNAEPDGLVLECVLSARSDLNQIPLCFFRANLWYSTVGNLWVAVYGTSSVMVFNPEGKLLRQIKLPAIYPTCPTWGGKNNDILFITTARDRTDTPDPNDEGGHMYLVHPANVHGTTKYEFAG